MQNFHESFSEASADVYYLFLGKATPFTSGTTGGSDTSPSTPADSVSREFYNWDSMIGAKKITSSDIVYAYLEETGQTIQCLICTKIILVLLILQQVVHQTFLTLNFIL